MRVGTCSWADEALSKYFYPPGLPAGERLAHYAREFDTVEVDSTYYRLPAEQMVEGITRYLIRQTNDGVLRRAPSQERLRKILGVVDKRLPFAAPDLIATTSSSAVSRFNRIMAAANFRPKRRHRPSD